jgi:RNA polymerase sigma factor (sigma-70 family)
MAMAQAASPSVLRYLRTLSAKEGLKDVSDSELLSRFAAERDEAAFAAMVRRHGGMVLQLCRSLLPNHADADDAFQATFLVLSRRAGSIRKHGSLGSWLYGVAYRTALKARTASAKRRDHEARARSQAPPNPVDELTWREAQWVLHQELARLPEKYRAPLVLCYLQEKRQDEVGRILGWPYVKVRSMLERARQRLRQRLVRRGLGPSAVLLALVGLGQSVVAAPVGAVVASTVGAAASFANGQPAAGPVSANVVSLAEHVLRTMSTSKITLTFGTLLAVAALGIGFGHRSDVAPTQDAEPARQITLPARQSAPRKSWHVRARPAPIRKAKISVRASSSWDQHTPDRAFDGAAGTMWNAGAYAPQWLEADLGSSAQLTSLDLIMTQLPAGETTHEVWVSREPIGEEPTGARLVHTFTGQTDNYQRLKLKFPRGLRARYVQIRTTQSPSWVGWLEVELRLQRPDGQYLCWSERTENPVADANRDRPRLVILQDNPAFGRVIAPWESKHLMSDLSLRHTYALGKELSENRDRTRFIRHPVPVFGPFLGETISQKE